VVLLAIGGGAFAFASRERGETVAASDPDRETTDVASVSEPDATTSTPGKTEDTQTTVAGTVPDAVPNLVNLSLDEAKALVKGSGVTLKVVNVADDETASGTVVKQSPEAGAPFTETVVVNVARPSVKTYLIELTPVEESDGGLSDTGNATLNAETLTNSLWMASCNWFDDQSPSVGYNLSRAYTRFHTIVGMQDDQVSGSFAQFRVFGDGRQLADIRADLGAPQTIDVDVSGVLRLTIQATGVGCNSYTHDPVYATWGDPYLTSPPRE